MLIDVEIYLDKDDPDNPITQQVDVDPNGVVQINSHRGSDFARFPSTEGQKLIIRLFPAPAVGPPPPEPTGPDVTSVDPTEVSLAAGISTVHVFGTRFSDPSTIYINNIFQPTTWVSDTELSCNYTPDQLGAKTVKVMSNSVMSTSSATLTVLA